MNPLTHQKHNPQSSCADSILHRIEEEKVAPRSRWYFVLKNEFFWGVGIVSVIVGSCSVAAALFALSNSDFDFYETTHGSMSSFLYDALPFMWLLSMAVFIGVGYLQFKHTSRGYRYPIYVIIGGAVVLTCVGGIALHTVGFGEQIERNVGPYMPFHKLPERQRQERWVNADRGVIAGAVVEIAPDHSSFVIKDFAGRPWIVSGQDLIDRDIELLKVDTLVRVIGLPTFVSTSSEVLSEFEKATSTIHACFVIPWDPTAPIGHPPVVVSTSTFSPNGIVSPPRDGGLPPGVQRPPLAVRPETDSDERKIVEGRITECKDVRPYRLIMRMRADAQYQPAP